MKGDFKRLPRILKKNILCKIGLGVFFLTVFILMCIFMEHLIFALAPGAFAIFSLMDGIGMTFRCMSGEYVELSGTTVEDFNKALDQLFAQFGKSMEQLQKLLSIHINYPVNTMTRVCKKLSMPKKAATEAIAMFSMSCGETSTAHEIFMAMQEIPYILKLQNTPESKMLTVEENMARMLTLNWEDFDLATEVSY